MKFTWSNPLRAWRRSLRPGDLVQWCGRLGEEHIGKIEQVCCDHYKVKKGLKRGGAQVILLLNEVFPLTEGEYSEIPRAPQGCDPGHPRSTAIRHADHSCPTGPVNFAGSGGLFYVPEFRWLFKLYGTRPAKRRPTLRPGGSPERGDEKNPLVGLNQKHAR